MSQDWYGDVRAFHEAFGCVIGDSPAVPDAETVELRKRLNREEDRELEEAIEAGDLAGIADGCLDGIYTRLGLLISYGIDARPIWDEIQRSNMAKAGGETRPDGKKLKPPGWTPPDVAGLIERQIEAVGRLKSSTRQIAERLSEHFYATGQFDTGTR